MKQYLLFLTTAALSLTSCSTVSPPPASKNITKAVPSTITAAPDLMPASQICATLKSQLQTQLPLQIQSQLQWAPVAMHDPLQPNGPLLAMCQINLRTNGTIILQQGLTPNFMSEALQRLDWAGSTPQTNAYAADGPTGHQEALVNGTQLAVMHYTFTPPTGACRANQPIAACKVSQKKWNYAMTTWVWQQGTTVSS